MWGGLDIHPTKNLKFVIRSLFEYLKYLYLYLYLSIYMLMDKRFGRIGRTGRVWWFFAHPYSLYTYS